MGAFGSAELHSVEQFAAAAWSYGAGVGEARETTALVTVGGVRGSELTADGHLGLEAIMVAEGGQKALADNSGASGGGRAGTPPSKGAGLRAAG